MVGLWRIRVEKTRPFVGSSTRSRTHLWWLPNKIVGWFIFIYLSGFSVEQVISKIFHYFVIFV
jgi:hypothetical protein